MPRAAILRSLVELPAPYRITIARERYEQRARGNLAAEISVLDAQAERVLCALLARLPANP